MNQVSSTFTDTDFIDTCVLIFYKPSPLQKIQKCVDPPPDPLTASPMKIQHLVKSIKFKVNIEILSIVLSSLMKSYLNFLKERETQVIHQNWRRVSLFDTNIKIKKKSCIFKT